MGDWLAFWAAMGGSILGAIIGGAVSWMLARQASNETLRRDTELRKSQSRIDAFRALLKIQTITNRLHSIIKSFDEMFEAANTQGLVTKLEKWQIMMPISGVSSNGMTIDSNDVQMFVDNELDISNRSILLSEKYNSLIESIQTYNKKRYEISDLMPAQVQGNLGTTTLSQAEYLALQPRWAELRSLAEEIRKALAEDFKFSVELANDIGPAARRTLQDEKFPILDMSKLRNSSNSNPSSE